MSARPRIEEAMKQVDSKYKLVHAAVKRTLQLLNEGEDFFVRGKTELSKKTFQAIEDIAEGRVKVITLEPKEVEEEIETQESNK